MGVEVSGGLNSNFFSECWQVDSDNDLVQRMARTFQPAQCFDGTPNSLPLLHVLITVPIDAPSSYENEQYTLDAAEGSGVSITAESPQGARNAMATLSQLIAKTENGCVMSKQIHIFDAP